MRAAIAIALCCVAAPAAGQTPAAQAEALFDQGRDLMTAGKFAEACAAFERSEQLDPAVATLLNLAACREQNHQLATAWRTFTEANRMATAAGDPKLAKVATSHAGKLEPRLSKLTIAVAADRRVAGLEILRGTEPTDAAAWNRPLPLDGGTYTITARAPGREPWSTTKTLRAEGDVQRIDLPALAETKPIVANAANPSVIASTPGAASTPGTAKTPGPNPPGTGKAPGPASTPVSGNAPVAAVGGKPPAIAKTPVVADGPEPGASPTAAAPRTTAALQPTEEHRSFEAGPEERPSHAAPIAFGAAAIVLGGAAIGLELWGEHKYDDARGAMVQSERDRLQSAANTRRYLAEAAGVAAIGCAGAAVYLYLRDRGEHAAPRVAVGPLASPEGAGLAVVGRW